MATANRPSLARLRTAQDLEEELIALAPDELRRLAMATATQEQTLVGGVFVPILQNIAGGAGAGGLFAIAVASLAQPLGFSPGQGLALWAALVGGAVTCGFTAWRFFADEIGIGRRLYEMGAKSRQTEIDALRAESTALALEVVELKRGGATLPARKDSKREQVIKDATKIIKWYFTGAAIDRRSCEQRGMSQTSWAKARRLLQAAGLMGEEPELEVDSLAQGLGQLQAYTMNKKALAEAEQFVTPY